MILCINKESLKTSPDVQKDVNLEDLINNHTKYYSDVEEALKDNYVPLDFSVSVRSMYTNLVLQHDVEDEKRYYTNITNIAPYIHKGYDLIMFLTSIALMHRINYRLGFDDVMMRTSQFQPIGLYNPDPDLINPIIYSHVIMSDDGANKLVEYLAEGCRFVPIHVIDNPPVASTVTSAKGNIRALLDTFIIVKEEAKDE